MGFEFLTLHCPASARDGSMTRLTLPGGCEALPGPPHLSLGMGTVFSLQQGERGGRTWAMYTPAFQSPFSTAGAGTESAARDTPLAASAHGSVMLAAPGTSGWPRPGLFSAKPAAFLRPTPPCRRGHLPSPSGGAAPSFASEVSGIFSVTAPPPACSGSPSAAPRGPLRTRSDVQTRGVCSPGFRTPGARRPAVRSPNCRCAFLATFGAFPPRRGQSGHPAFLP